MPLRLGFGHFLEQPLTGNPERLSFVQLRHQIVIIGVEILGHLAGRRRLAGGSAAPCHAETGVEIDLPFDTAEAWRHRPHQHGNVEHLIVESEVTDGDDIQAGVNLVLPVRLAQSRAFLFESVSVQLALPVGFDGFLQFAMRADARIAQSVHQGGHLWGLSELTVRMEKIMAWRAVSPATHLESNAFI